MKLNNINMIYVEAIGEKWPCVYDLNVQSVLQEEYGTINKWIENLYGEEKKESEINIKTIIFTMKEMINEGIEIENEMGKPYREPISNTIAGIIITEMGVNKMLEIVNELGKAEQNDSRIDYTP